jgi:eukaryotic-like serine/threonine-protein kinase
MSLGGAFEQSSPRATTGALRTTNSGQQPLSGLRYRPIITLGQGGMADVLLSVGRGPSGFNKLVVLKAMRKELVADEDMRQMFLAEARLSARLNNANVVQVYEVIDTTLPCIVMEYLDGQPLSLLLQEAGERFTLPQQLKVLSEALAGLHYSHELNDYDGSPLKIVHRDVSPQNIFVTYDGVVKVLDFGIAKASNAVNQTRTGIIKGKIAYMPREQLLNEELDRRADIYAVGCMLWHAAAGCKLWSGMPEGEVMRALIDGRIPRPSERRPVDPKLEDIVMKTLATDPNDRYSTALELRTAIDDYLAEVSPKTTMREVGGLVSSLFAEQQEARKQQIQLALQAPFSEPPPAIPEGLESIIQTHDFTARGAKQAGKQPLVRIGIVVSVVALVAIALALALTPKREAQPHPQSRTEAKPSQIQVRLSATPAAAVLSVDGNPLASNPALLTIPPDDKDHEIRATLEGHEPYKRTVRFERDLALDMMLQPQATSSAPPSASQPRTTISATSHKKASAPANQGNKSKANCDPMFYFENGIKTYKPWCL